MTILISLLTIHRNALPSLAMKTKPLPKNPRLATPFAMALRERITGTIKELKKSGITAIGEDSLFAATIPRPADYDLPGGIKGTNARYHYRELFREVLADIPNALKFIIK